MEFPHLRFSTLTTAPGHTPTDGQPQNVIPPAIDVKTFFTFFYFGHVFTFINVFLIFQTFLFLFFSFALEAVGNV